MKAHPRELWPLLRPAAGLVVWSSAFVALYAGVSLGCRHLPVPDPAAWGNPVSALLLLLAAVHAAALFGLLLSWFKRRGSHDPADRIAYPAVLHRIEGLVLLISLAGLAWIVLPVMLVPPCAG